LAIEWVGHELPAWEDKCPITCHVGSRLGAGGATSFMFRQGRPFGWTMSIQGSRERILDSVLPHEITHTIFATHFGRPLPRWADEGACTVVEHVSERQKQHNMLYEFLTTHRGIAFNEMFAMKEYPHDVLPLYAQGYSLTRFLIAQGGKQKFLAYVGDGMRWKNWTKATSTHYGYGSLSELQVRWLDWVRRGSPKLSTQPNLIAQAAPEPAETLVAVAATEPHGDTPSRVVPAALISSNDAQDDAQPGWYARVRDRAVAARDTAVEPPLSQAGAVPNRNADEAVTSGAVARQQPIGRPRQIILEWSRPNNRPGSAGVSRPPTPRPTRQSSRNSQLVPNFGQRLLR